MALSNWDLMAWDEKGKSSNGKLAIRGRKVAEIYKNWVYVWQEGMAYPTQVDEGMMRFQSPLTMQVFAARGRQNSCFTAIATLEHNAKRTRTHALFGIGCCGYRGSRYVGVERKTMQAYFVWLEKVADELYVKPPLFRAGLRFNQGDYAFSRSGMYRILPTEVPATAPGEADEPMLSKWLQPTKCGSRPNLPPVGDDR